jgi:hypothetical protein
MAMSSRRVVRDALRDKHNQAAASNQVDPVVRRAAERNHHRNEKSPAARGGRAG